MKTYKRLLRQNKRAFTLIELIVVMAIIGVLVLLAAPRFLGQTEEAIFTKHLSNARNVEDASERYFIAEQDWPRLSDEAYTASEIEAYAESIYSITGETIDLDPEGDYYDIDYDALSDYVRVDASDKANYILQNPVGKVYYLEGLSESGENRADFESPGEGVEDESFEYVQATDEDFEKDNWGRWRYIGEDTHVIIPHVIDEETVTSYRNMFRDTAVEGVVSDNTHVTDMYGMFAHNTATTLDLSRLDTRSANTMSHMFWDSSAATLDLSNFDTSNVTTMSGMFYASSATTLDLSNFDTSNVTTMSGMFYASSATTLDLSHFDTSNVTSMGDMFQNSNTATLDLSSFDTSNVTWMHSMFENSSATTLDLSSFNTSNVTNRTSMFQNASARTGYARTTNDRNFFNHSDTNRPTGLSFELK